VSAAAILSLRGISHHFGALAAVHDFSLDIAAGEVVCLLGPSGCGKTTVLRLAAGLEVLRQGRIEIAGQSMAGGGRDLPPEYRQVGLVFQDYALFPHLTLLDNVAFGLAGSERLAVAQAWLARIGLAHRAAHFPYMLSGGEQQRVALARALAPKPRVMLMDEPFSSLDAGLRASLRRQALGLLREAGTATLLVTHDPEEAMAMADRIVVMRAGRPVQTGTPDEIYCRPASRFVAEFLGEANARPGQVQGGAVTTPFGPVPAPRPAEGMAVDVLVRPEALRLGRDGAPAEVVESRRIGGALVTTLKMADGSTLVARAYGGDPASLGSTVGVAVAPGELLVLPAER
jgi:iron(III) transport system ATP-binding protein